MKLFVREIQSPLGDGNVKPSLVLITFALMVREIQSPLGDGNHLVNQ